MTTLYDFQPKLADQTPFPLEQLRGKVLLIVNTASKCGFTPQYNGLEAIHRQFHARGLEVMGFPCNQFGAQEPGNAEEIGAFCEKNYGVSFPLFAKIDVNGAQPEETPEEEEQGASAPEVAEEQTTAPQADAEPAAEVEGSVPPAPDFQSAIANPNAWWNVLQEQFKHAVGNALAGGLAEQEPLLKPAKPPKPEKAPKRSENKTVAPKPKAGVKAKPAGAPKPAKGAKTAPKKPPVKKAPKRAENTSAPARTAVVQSRQNKKPASRKPNSP